MKISASRISSPLKEYNMMNRDLLQKFKKGPGLENPLLNYMSLKRKTTQSSTLAQRKALGGKKSENNLDENVQQNNNI